MCSQGKYVTSFWKISRRIPRTESIIHTELSCIEENLLPTRDAVRIPRVQVEGAIGVAGSQYLFLETFLATRIFFRPRCFRVCLCCVFYRWSLKYYEYFILLYGVLQDRSNFNLVTCLDVFDKWKLLLFFIFIVSLIGEI